MEKVVLLHGIWRTARSMRALARYLEGQGFTVLNLDYPSTRMTLEALVEHIHPQIRVFAGDGAVHFVGHSMGGLLTRAYIARYRPALGRVVMLGTPNHGSEVADFLKNWRLYRWQFGPAGQQLVTDDTVRAHLFGPVDFPLGIIAGNYAMDKLSAAIIGQPNDGKVSVESTKLEGMAAHVVVPVSHLMLPYNGRVMALSAQFLRTGLFTEKALIS